MLGWLLNLGFAGGGTSRIDTHDGFTDIIDDGPRKRKQYKEAREKLREDIEKSFSLIFKKDLESVSKEEVKEIKKVSKALNAPKIKEISLESIEQNKAYLNWLLKRSQDEEEETIAMLLLH